MGLTRALRRMGHEARLLAPCDGPPPASFVHPMGNSLPTAMNGSVAPIAPDPAAQFRTIRLLLEEDFDVLHVHEPLAPGPTETALFLHPAPIVATYHAAGESPPYAMFTWYLRWLSERVDRRVVVSKDARELIERHMGGEYEVLFNGVEIERYRDAVPKQLPGRSIFFCGRHEERKGLGVLIDAFKTLDMPDVHLLIGSFGPDTKKLRAQAGDDPRIEWLGRLSDDDKRGYMKAASVFCAPSLRGESFGVVLLESMAAGTPVVASALDGYKNVATDGIDALLPTPGDATELATALRRVLDDTGLAEGLRQAGELRAADFGMESLAREYVAIYEELVDEWEARGEARARQVSRWRRMAGRMMQGVRGGWAALSSST